MPTTFKNKHRFTLGEVLTAYPTLKALVPAMLTHRTGATRPSTLISRLHWRSSRWQTYLFYLTENQKQLQCFLNITTLNLLHSFQRIGSHPPRCSILLPWQITSLVFAQGRAQKHVVYPSQNRKPGQISQHCGAQKVYIKFLKDKPPVDIKLCGLTEN